MNKTIFITGVEGQGSGLWDWTPDKESSDEMHRRNIQTFSELDGEIIYRGEMNVDAALSNDEITNEVEDYLLEHGFENSPLINKEIYQKS